MEEARAYLSERRQEVSAATIHDEVRALRRFGKWFAETYDAPDPYAHLRLPRVPQPVPGRVATVEAVDALLWALRRHKGRERIASARSIAIVRVFQTTGARLSEVARMNVGDIDFRARRIAIDEANNNQGRFVPPNDLTANCIRIWIDSVVSGTTAMATSSTCRGKSPRYAQCRRRTALEVARCVTSITRIHGIGPVTAAIIIGRVGDVRRFPTAGHFARHNGTAPIEASSSPRARHRLNPRGDRQLNHAIHMAAVTQVAHDTPGRVYYLRKQAEEKTRKEAMRALKRSISDAVYRHLVADTQH